MTHLEPTVNLQESLLTTIFMLFVYHYFVVFVVI